MSEYLLSTKGLSKCFGHHKAVGRIGVKDFALIRYTVTGKISLLSMAPTDHECMTALIIAISFGGSSSDSFQSDIQEEGYIN